MNDIERVLIFFFCQDSCTADRFTDIGRCILPENKRIRKRKKRRFPHYQLKEFMIHTSLPFCLPKMEKNLPEREKKERHFYETSSLAKIIDFRRLPVTLRRRPNIQYPLSSAVAKGAAPPLQESQRQSGGRGRALFVISAGPIQVRVWVMLIQIG